MITAEEKNLGRRFALGALTLLLANFLIQVFVLGPDASGYNETWGPAVGNTVGYGIGIVTLVFLAGLFPDAAFIPLNVILGVVLTPAWFFAISKAYAS